MKRIYKERAPKDTILIIKDILNKLGLITYESFLGHPYSNIYSCRTETIDSQGNFGQNGKGLTLEYCLASSHAEFMERLQNGLFFDVGGLQLSIIKRLQKKCGFYFFPDEKEITLEEVMALPNHYLRDVFGNKSKSEIKETLIKCFEKVKANGSNGILGIPFYDYTENTITYLPYNITFMLTGSNGMAAGNTINESLFQALCEILERLAATIVYYKQLTPPTIPDSYICQYTKIYSIIKDIRASGYELYVKDFSLGKHLPVLGTIIINKKKNKYKLNIGSDTSFEVALSRTLTEIHQGLKNQEDFENHLLDIPETVQDYFLDDSFSSVKKRDREIEQFKINGQGVFPRSIFEKEESYKFNPITFTEHANYQEETVYLFGLITKMGEHIYVRDTSFLGFPSCYIYVTNYSLLGKKVTNAMSQGNIDFKQYLDNDDLEKAFEDFSNIYDRPEKMQTILNHYVLDTINEPNEDSAVQSILKLEFPEKYYWHEIPISYFLVVFSYLMKQYTKAKVYLKCYLKKMKITNNDYYIEVDKYFTLLERNTDQEYIRKHISERVLFNFKRENLTQLVDLPNCPNCESCKLALRCKTRNKLKAYISVMLRMKESHICQKKSFKYYIDKKKISY